MTDKRTRRGLRSIREGVITIVLVLVCFLVLMSILNALFPTGTGINLLLGRQPEPGESRSGNTRSLQMQRGDESAQFATGYGWAATLDKTAHRVKSKRGNDIAWQAARKGMRLYDEDAIQTLDKSTALIRFDEQNAIDLGENSLIVIRRMEQDLLFREKRSYMVMVDGTLRGTLNASDDNGVYLEVTLPNAVTRLQAQAGGGETVDFRIDVQQDQGSAVTIFSGHAEVEAQGEAVLLEANQMTRIDGQSSPSDPLTLPPAARLIHPTPQQHFSYRSLPPRIKLQWQAPTGIARYHLLLARDRDFSQLLVDERLTQTSFTHGNLTPGDYFWKVSSFSGQVEGPFGEVRHFTLRQDQQPPRLELSLPDAATQSRLQLTGHTEPDARLYISGESVVLGSDGTFRHALALEPGINVVVVEAVDAAGNVTYRSQLIQGKF